MSRKKKSKAPVPADPISTRASIQHHPFPVRHVLAFSLMAVLALVTYSNTFHVPFHFDDDPNIVFNASTHLRSFSFRWVSQLIQANFRESLRVFAYFTFALNYYFGGLQVFGYHLVNLLIHLGCSLLLYWFLLLTFSLPSLKERYGTQAFSIALFSSLLFLCHPIQTQSVTYIVQRMASMAGLFYLLALTLYVKGRLSSGRKRWLLWLGMAGSYFLGLFTKENVAILPLFVALYEFYFFQNLEVSPKTRKALFYTFGPVLLLGVLMVLVWGRRYVNVIVEGYQIRDFTLTERVLTQFRVVLYYLTLLVCPHPSRLNLDYDFPTSHGMLDPPTTLLSILIVFGLIGYSLWSCRKRPLLSYFIFWYFGNLVIESSIFPLEMVYEHRLYLPMVGPVVLFVVLVLKGWERIRDGLRLRLGQDELKTRMTDTTRRNYPLWAFFLALTGLLCFGSYERNKIWRDPLTLWEDCLNKSPNKPRSHTNLGFYLVQDNQVEKGVEHYDTALKLNPKFVDAHFNLAQVYGERRQFDQAEVHLKECIRLAPEDPRGYNEMGLIRLQKGDFDEAIRFLKRALEINPFLGNVHANLGNTYLQVSRLDQALSEYERALQLNPDLSEVHLKMAEIYTKKGRPELAAKELEIALENNPSLSEAHFLRGMAYIEQGKVDEGIGELNAALKLNPKDPKLYNNLGLAYRTKKLFDEALLNYRKALDLDPSFLDARVNLAETYFQKGMVDEAVSELRKASRLDPNRAEIHNNLGVIFLQRKNLDEAVSSFKRALAIDPKHGDACFNLAVAYYYKKDIPAASSYAKRPWTSVIQ